MTIYKQIFDNNSNKLVKEFFRDDFIRKLWPTITKYMTYQIVFGKKAQNKEIDLTFKEISRIMPIEYDL